MTVDLYQRVLDAHKANSAKPEVNTPEMQKERERVRNALSFLLAQGEIATNEDGLEELDFTIIAAQWQGIALGLVDATPAHQLRGIVNDLPTMFSNYLSAVLVQARLADHRGEDRGIRPLAPPYGIAPADLDGLKASVERLRDLSEIAFQAHDARLTALNEWQTYALRLRAAVKEAAEQFRWYGDLHAAKPDDEKAKRNYDLEEKMLDALLSFTPSEEKKTEIDAPSPNICKKAGEHLIWWTSQEDCDQFMGKNYHETIPSPYQERFMSRLGRSGRGRLWAENWAQALIENDQLNSKIGKRIIGNNCGGVVFVADKWPEAINATGFVTDFDLNIVTGIEV